MAGIAEVLHMSIGGAKGLVDRGAFIDPDVLMGRPASPEVIQRLTSGGRLEHVDDLVDVIAGWSHDRIVRYGIEIGRLAEDGSPLMGGAYGRPGGRVAVKRQRSWYRKPRLLLTQAGIADVLKVGKNVIMNAHSRGMIVDPVVEIGHRRFGWSPEDVIPWARQSGYLRGKLS